MQHVIRCALLALACSCWARADFLYVNNQSYSNPTNIVGYRVADDGSVTLLPGSPFASGGTGVGGGLFAVRRIVATSGSHLYAVNGGDQSISAFSIDPGTGALTAVAGSPFATNHLHVQDSGADISLAVSPDEKFLFAATQVNGQLFVFKVGPSGALSPVQGSPFSVLRGMDGVEVTPDGAYLAVAQFGGGISLFRITPDGAASLASTYPEWGPGSSAGLACNCAGTHLFVAKANYLNQTILGVYNLGNGLLNPIAGSPFQFPNEINSSVVVLTPDDRYAFVSNQGNNLESASVSAFRILSDGTPTQVNGSPFYIAGAFAPASLALNGAGTLLATAGPTGDVAVFRVTAGGQLSLGPGSPFKVFPNLPGLRDVAIFPPKTCCQEPSVQNLIATPNVLWPVNHKMVEVTLNYSVDTPCGATRSLSVSANEPAEGDWQILDDSRVLLRAERTGNGGDRVYTITVTARSTAGRTATASVAVTVPHDAGH